MYSYADGGMAADPMMMDPMAADPMADPLMDNMDPMAMQPMSNAEGDPEALAAAAFEVATEYLPAVPTPILEQTLMAFAAEFEQRMGGGQGMQPQAAMAAPASAEAMPAAAAAPAQGIGSLV